MRLCETLTIRRQEQKSVHLVSLLDISSLGSKNIVYLFCLIYFIRRRELVCSADVCVFKRHLFDHTARTKRCLFCLGLRLLKDFHHQTARTLVLPRFASFKTFSTRQQELLFCPGNSMLFMAKAKYILLCPSRVFI